MTEAIYNHPHPIDTVEGPMIVSVRFNTDTQLVLGAVVTLVSHNESMGISTTMFWALLDEDAQEIYDQILKTLSDPVA